MLVQLKVEYQADLMGTKKDYTVAAMKADQTGIKKAVLQDICLAAVMASKSVDQKEFLKVNAMVESKGCEMAVKMGY